MHIQSLIPTVILLINCNGVLGFIPQQGTTCTLRQLSIKPKFNLSQHTNIPTLSKRTRSLQSKHFSFPLNLLQNKYRNCDHVESSSLSLSSSDEDNTNNDPVLRDVATRLRRVNWISWWSQVILTVISSITLLFARGVLNALSGTVVTSTGSRVPASTAPGGFLFAGSGVVLSYLSIIWTWGGTRLSRRLRRNSTKNYSRIKAATMIRRAIVIGVTLNLLGMLVTLIGAEQIVGLLAAKVLTMQGISPFQASFGLNAGLSGVNPGTQSVQPLDVLIVQANTNTLLSHFLSLVCCLILTRSVHALDPPSVEDDER